MGNIIDINKYKLDRDRYEFKGRTVLLHDEHRELRKYSCIVLEDRNSGDIVSYTGLERYVVDLSDVTSSEATYSYAESRVRGFLNYILHETEINFIHEISLNDIRRYLEYRRTDEKGEEITSDAWGRIRSDVIAFLMNYYKHNKDKVPFHYSPDNLIEIAVVKEKTDRGTRKHVISQYKTLGIKPPKKNNNHHRKRTIMYGHLEAMLYAARKYDPMIHLAMCLMAYAGLREGEVVNLSFSDIRLSGGLGIVDKIEIYLKDSDKFRKGKTHTGVIKKIREQLNGDIILIEGNHDRKNLTTTAREELFKYVTWQMLIEIEGRKVLLNHFPFLCYAGTYREPKRLVFSLYGHTHSGPDKKGQDIPRLVHCFPTQYDVGVDNNNYEPISWEELNTKIQLQLLKSKYNVK